MGGKKKPIPGIRDTVISAADLSLRQLEEVALDEAAQAELARAMAEVVQEQKSEGDRLLDDPAREEQKDRSLFDREEFLSATEWKSYRTAIQRLEKLPALEKLGVLTFEQRCAREEELLDLLDALDEKISERRRSG